MTKQEIVTQIEFRDHCKANAETDKKLDKLMPLVDLIPTLQEIVESQKANVIVAKKVLRFVGYASAVIGLIYLIFKFWKDIK